MFARVGAKNEEKISTFPTQGAIVFFGWVNFFCAFAARRTHLRSKYCYWAGLSAMGLWGLWVTGYGQLRVSYGYRQVR